MNWMCMGEYENRHFEVRVIMEIHDVNLHLVHIRMLFSTKWRLCHRAVAAKPPLVEQLGD